MTNNGAKTREKEAKKPCMLRPQLNLEIIPHDLLLKHKKKNRVRARLKAEKNVSQHSVYSWRNKVVLHSQMWMSVYKNQTSAVLTPCAATPKGHITATVTQGTLATDETVHG